MGYFESKASILQGNRIWKREIITPESLLRGSPPAEYSAEDDMTKHPEAKGEMAPEAAAGFEEVDHTADVALRLWAPDFETLLVQAARGSALIMAGKLPFGPFPVRKHLALEAFDRESLLVAFLGELTYSAEADREIFSIFEFDRVTDRKLVAVAQGVRIPVLKTVIKAVTYHDLEIVETERGLEATVVFDV